MLHPRVELLSRFGDDPESHVRMLQSAELGALSAKLAGMVRLESTRL